MFFVMAAGLLLGLCLGTTFRVLVLVPVQLIVGAAVVIGSISHAISLQQGFSGFAGISVALQLGYLASAVMPLRALAAGRPMKRSRNLRSDQ